MAIKKILLLSIFVLFSSGSFALAEPSPIEKSKVDIAKLKEYAEMGDPSAQAKLGMMYGFGRDGVQKDMNEAVKWWKKAADNGRPDAQMALAEIYTDGNGVPKDDKEASEWWKKAAESGMPRALEVMGGKYYYGRGVQKDTKEAAKWYQKAASKGSAEAQNKLAQMYATGDGVEKKPDLAAGFLEKKAIHGDADSQFLLAKIYADDDYSKKSLLRAGSWCYVAQKSGSKEAAQGCKDIEKKMQPSEIDGAKAFADDWMKKNNQTKIPEKKL